MNARTRIAAVAIACLLPAAAHACGYCVEDKIAAVYDHPVVVRAAGQQHRVAFFALAGPLSASDPATRRAIERAVASTSGVDAQSIRLSLGNAALSFAFNPRGAPFGLLQRTLARKLAVHGVSLELVSTMDQPGDLKVTRARR